MSMSEAMNAAGITTPDQRRRQLRQDAIKRAKTQHEALELFREALETDPHAALTLFSPSEIAQRARQEVEQAWPTTTRQNGGHDAADGRAGQLGSDTQASSTRPATGQNPAETAGGGAKVRPTPTGATPPPTARAARPRREPGGQSASDTQTSAAPRPHSDTPQLRTGDAMRAAARPKRTGAGTDIGAAMRNCALDRIRINGKPLRFAKPEEALQQAELWHIEARTVEAICTGLAPDQPVGEQLSDEEANRLADRASKTTA